MAEIPGQDLVPKHAQVKAYAVADRHDWIWVWMGDPAGADEALIPPAVGLSDPDYILGHGQLDYAAEARLINDNLLDFSHLSYVHANSFGAGPEFAQSLPKLEPLERGVRYSRSMTDTMGQSSRKSDEPIDSYMTYDFLIPGVLLMWSGNHERGTAKKLDFAPPRLEDARAGVTFTSQAVTPVIARAPSAAQAQKACVSAAPSEAGPRRDNFTFSGRIATQTIAFVTGWRGSATKIVPASRVAIASRLFSRCSTWPSNKLTSPTNSATQREPGAS